MVNRRRNGFILLLVAGLLVASITVILTMPTKLGLDLQGGVELVYQGKPTPQQPEVTQEALDRAVEIMRERVDALGVSEPEIQRSGSDQIAVGLPNVTNARRAQEQVGRVAQLQIYDWQPNVIGPENRPDPTNREVTEVPLSSLYEAVKRASKQPPRLNPNRTNKGPQYYLFDRRTQRLRVGPEDSRADLLADYDGKQPPGTEILTIPPGTVVVKAEQPPDWPSDRPYDRYFVLRDNPELNGTDIRNPEQNFEQGAGGSGAPVVTYEFTDEGQKKQQRLTKRIVDRGRNNQIPGEPPQNAFQNFAAVLDGEIITRPYIDFNENPNGIDGRTGAQIGGTFTIQEAQDLARLLQAGALPIKLELISQSQVSATLGKQALDQGLLAGIAGFLIVALFLIAYYRLLGVIAAVALVIYAIYFFALIKLIPITLTLPGIAGLILTIGVAADANIVIFERVKEEIRNGRSVPAGIAAGYKKGLSAIIDANVVTIMTAFILFVLATAGVKGFAFVLGVGTIVSLFTAVLATSAFLGTLSNWKVMSRPSLLGAGKQRFRWRPDFIGASRWFFSMSGVILLIGALAIGGKGLNFGIDFESGTRIKVAFSEPVTESQLRTVLDRVGAGDAKIQRVTGERAGTTEFQVSTETLKPAQVNSVRTGLADREVATFDTTSIGPTFGETVARSALIAIVASLLVISAYIALRFEWKYAVPVLIALMHDILITSGVYALVGREVTTSTVAALLTILGYSLYDTIIVFDRVRENVPRMPRAAFTQIVNRSLSEVLTRSLATSFSTLLPVLCLFLFGGETLQDFAFALIVGIASGAYSSLFIATPLLAHSKEREEVYRRRRRRIESENDGHVPAYPPDGESLERDPTPRRRSRRLTQPDAPDGPEVSRQEWDEMVADIAHEAPSSSAATRTRKRKPVQQADEEQPAPTSPAGNGGPAPDATPEEVDAAMRPKSEKKKGGGKSSRRPHGRRR